jgi:hypothetical protein
MYCIFCKNDSSTSVSVEHIIPESLGNKTHTLPRGIVCDKCNNYFARKIEKPLLDSDYFTHSRFRNFLPNKKGRIPPIENGLLLAHKPIKLGMGRETEGHSYIYPLDEESLNGFMGYMRTQTRGELLFPIPAPVEPYLVTRFLAKVGLEALAHKVIPVPGWETELIFKQELDEVRNYARYGDVNKNWPFYERRLYGEHKMFTDETGQPYEILHEFNTLYTDHQELYVVVIILGVEYTINLGGPEIDGYEKWLKEHGYMSPLYPKGI